MMCRCVVDDRMCRCIVEDMMCRCVVEDKQKSVLDDLKTKG